MGDPEASDISQKSEKKEGVNELPTPGQIDLGFGDDDEDSDASLDPEAELDKLESIKDSAKSENIENTDISIELPDEEFIIDDEDFVIQETKSDIKIFEEEVIPEEKVIANEKDQNDDLLNEIVRLLPEKLR